MDATRIPNSTKSHILQPECLTRLIGSSYVRHSKKCLESTITASPRQKSCFLCAAAKAKCDQKRPKCTRCTDRNVPCKYARSRSQGRGEQTSLQRSSTPISRDSASPLNEDLEGDVVPSVSPKVIFEDQRWQTSPQSIVDRTPDTPNSVSVLETLQVSFAIRPEARQDTSESLISNAADTIFTNAHSSTAAPPSNNITQIRDRWLYPYIEKSPEKHAVMKQSMSFLCRGISDLSSNGSEKRSTHSFHSRISAATWNGTTPSDGLFCSLANVGRAISC